jgi:DNA-binding CsgD family transcriptional regulator
MSRISKVQTYAVNWLSQQGKTPDEISEELKLSTDQVKKILEKNNKVNNDGASIKTTQEPAVSKSKNMMINTTMGKQSKTVSIMTREASEYNDAIKNTLPPAKIEQNRWMKDGIFIPSESKNKNKGKDK